MKVKISYTVDLDDVPNEINPLIEKAKKNIDGAFKSISELKKLKDHSTEGAIVGIEDIRKAMMEADLALGDCESILVGYLSAKYSDPDIPTLSGQEEEGGTSGGQ